MVSGMQSKCMLDVEVRLTGCEFSDQAFHGLVHVMECLFLGGRHRVLCFFIIITIILLKE